MPDSYDIEGVEDLPVTPCLLFEGKCLPQVLLWYTFEITSGAGVFIKYQYGYCQEHKRWKDCNLQIYIFAAFIALMLIVTDVFLPDVVFSPTRMEYMIIDMEYSYQFYHISLE